MDKKAQTIVSNVEADFESYSTADDVMRLKIDISDKRLEPVVLTTTPLWYPLETVQQQHAKS